MKHSEQQLATWNMFIHFICLFARVLSLLTIESTKKLQVMISAVSRMLLKGLHCATSRASYTRCKQETLERSTFNISLSYILFLLAKLWQQNVPPNNTKNITTDGGKFYWHLWGPVKKRFVFFVPFGWNSLELLQQKTTSLKANSWDLKRLQPLYLASLNLLQNSNAALLFSTLQLRVWF